MRGRIWIILLTFYAATFSPDRVAVAAPVLRYLLGEVDPGESFEIRFQFDVPPVNADGHADSLVVKGGSSNRRVLFSWVDLYADDVLLGRFAGATNAFGVFTQGDAQFSIWKNPTNLTPIWNGAIGKIVFRPVFDPAFSDPYLEYQVNWLYAARDLGGFAYDDAYVQPVILSTQVNSVPEPATLSLFAFGTLAMWGGLRRRIDQKRYPCPRGLTA